MSSCPLKLSSPSAFAMGLNQYYIIMFQIFLLFYFPFLLWSIHMNWYDPVCCHQITVIILEKTRKMCFSVVKKSHQNKNKTRKPSFIFKGHPCMSEIRSAGSRMWMYRAACLPPLELPVCPLLPGQIFSAKSTSAPQAGCSIDNDVSFQVWQHRPARSPFSCRWGQRKRKGGREREDTATYVNNW